MKLVLAVLAVFNGSLAGISAYSIYAELSLAPLSFITFFASVLLGLTCAIAAGIKIAKET